jgi:hypothetical protein
MRAAVIVVFVSVLATASEASKSCMSKTEARQHFGSVWIYWHGKDHCWDATRGSPHHQIRQVQLNVQRKVDQPKWRNSMSKMLPDAEPAQAAAPPMQTAPWTNRWVDLESPTIDADIAQVAPPPIIEREPEPPVTPRGVIMVIITIILAFAFYDVLFGGRRSAEEPYRPY